MIRIKAMKEYREKKRFSRADLAGRVGVHKDTIARYERGERSPSAKTLKKIAEALGCSADELLRE